MQEPTFLSFLIASISNLGFPVVLAGYLLLRFEKKIETLNDTIVSLLQIIREERTNKNAKS